MSPFRKTYDNTWIYVSVKEGHTWFDWMADTELDFFKIVCELCVPPQCNFIFQVSYHTNDLELERRFRFKKAMNMTEILISFVMLSVSWYTMF